MAETWYSADLHLGHSNIIKYCDRPWDNVQAMNDSLVERWNAVVAGDDTVWVLGDVALTPRAIYPVARLNGIKILVAGNHDACWTGHRRTERARRTIPTYLEAGFAAVHESGIVTNHVIGSKPVVLAHLPYAGDHTETDRYAEHRPADNGLPLICGHAHTAWKTSGRQINVGVDVWDYRPVAESTLADLISDLPR
jgi:calcineurin-like phosphoesterase family protein